MLVRKKMSQMTNIIKQKKEKKSPKGLLGFVMLGAEM